jgi:hypothetical protein
MVSLLTKGLISIFITTFFLVFILLFMVEPNLICEEVEGSAFPECRVSSYSGDFILGVAIAGVLFLLDMGLVYIILSDILI